MVELMREHLALLEPLSLDIVDQSAQHAGHPGAGSGGGHFAVTLVSSRFAGRRLMERHRMVYDALRPLMQQHIHALSISAKAPDEK